ncbi:MULTISPECIES: FAD synthetase family protein [Pseudothermotoga]|uniref:FAD synthase n=1 Tax=Pseudothermotoga lettingae (strain ATCC BAA-301 / DSM 14385 / NBRC 107922 / TMO) TaxID=416591 RepID=A8F703_PSELT|nr:MULTISPECIES: FAD synthetase family protein [Pseudothermotoga]ABV33937.1 cytidyltransferase-related domain [Pseudothermotoga lettingae TMO]KUK21959.1 MAG: Cytidyltransferase-related domain [Pseudothermotoga lettingae]MDI3494622.1 riboflavin kinase / adenylyltransferase [Pseudothermotoga sp.]MDK2884230.1 riboflavin kinase / adenylyltransferase [Pseudothermotoga sp.]GLI49126.1 hypothetical protein PLETTINGATMO_12950 [Pseudothermotoga lettingae TMO]
MKKSAVTVGVFDGVHLGHQRLLKRVQQISEEYKITSTVYVVSYPFDFFDENFEGLIMPISSRVAEISRFAQYIEVLDLLEIKDMPAEDFFKEYLSDAEFLVVGEDFKFGKNATGDIALLRRLCSQNGTKLEIFSDITDLKGNRISSSLLRKLIQHGDIDNVSKLLGRDYLLEFVIESIDENSDKMHCYLKADEKIVLPKEGVFEVFEELFGITGRVQFGKKIIFTAPKTPLAVGSMMQLAFKRRLAN